MCSFRSTAQLIRFNVMQRRLVTVNVHDKFYFFFRLHINLPHVMYLECLPSAKKVSFESRTPLVSGCINCALFSVMCQRVCMTNVTNKITQ